MQEIQIFKDQLNKNNRQLLFCLMANCELIIFSMIAFFYFVFFLNKNKLHSVQYQLRESGYECTILKTKTSLCKIAVDKYVLNNASTLINVLQRKKIQRINE